MANCKYRDLGRNHYGTKKDECTHKDRYKLKEGPDKATLTDKLQGGILSLLFGKSCTKCILNYWDKPSYCPLYQEGPKPISPPAPRPKR